MNATKTSSIRLIGLALVTCGLLYPVVNAGETGTPQEGVETAEVQQVEEHPPAGSAVDTSCLRCHEPIREQIEAAVPHEPAADEDCDMCHNPHAARYENLLNVRPRALCFSCHREQALSFQTGFVHTPVKEGDCNGCHASHGSEHPGLLRAEGNSLCADCHQPMFASLENKKVHEPVLEGECLDCHSAHNSGFPNQLTGPANKLCSLCHDATKAELIESHYDIPIQGARCTSCHDAHASVDTGLLLPVTHEPFADGSCEMCHLVESESPRLVRATGARLCLACHKEYPRSDDQFVHQPVAEGDCASCHAPHASRDKHLLTAGLEQTCLSCHADIVQRKASARSVHPTDFDDGGSCGACHQPHSSQENFLLSQGPIRTCLTCHETQRHGHPLGEGRLDPRTGTVITCVTCHDPHGTEFSYQLRGDQSRGLCLECHTSGD